MPEKGKNFSLKNEFLSEMENGSRIENFQVFVDKMVLKSDLIRNIDSKLIEFHLEYLLELLVSNFHLQLQLQPDCVYQFFFVKNILGVKILRVKMVEI